MANQVDWAAKTQEWSTTLASIYKTFPEMPEDLSGEEAERRQAQIDQFIQSIFREPKQKEKCVKIFNELIPFVDPLTQITDHPVLRYKELQQIEPTKKVMVSLLEMVAKVQCLGSKELTQLRSDSVYKGCVQVAHVYDTIPFSKNAALPQDPDSVNWMDPSLAHHVVATIREAAQSDQDEATNRRCQAIFRSLKAYMEQLRHYYVLPALGEWSFYNACLGIFPYVIEGQDWADKIQRLAIARLSKNELNKVKTPPVTPTKEAQSAQGKDSQPPSRADSPTKVRLAESSAKLQADLDKEHERMKSAKAASVEPELFSAFGTAAPLTPPASAPAPSVAPGLAPSQQAIAPASEVVEAPTAPPQQATYTSPPPSSGVAAPAAPTQAAAPKAVSAPSPSVVAAPAAPTQAAAPKATSASASSGVPVAPTQAASKAGATGSKSKSAGKPKESENDTLLDKEEEEKCCSLM